MTFFKYDSKNPLLSPSYFIDKAIPLEVQEFNKFLLEQSAQLPSVLDLTPQEIRARDLNWATQRSSIAVDRYIQGRSGNNIKLRQFIPPNTIKGVYLYIHGGGWISGTADWQDTRLENIAIQGQMAVISVEYRLAPEHPYPAAIDDCEAAALWLIENASREFHTDNVLLGGNSAGAHLCVKWTPKLRQWCKI